MTKLTVNRLAYALDDLAGHMDVDQFAPVTTARRAWRRLWSGASRGLRGASCHQLASRRLPLAGARIYTGLQVNRRTRRQFYLLN